MGKIIAIAINTFKEAVRNRVLYVLLFFSVLIMLGAWVASTLSIEGPERIIRNLGVASINIIAGLIAVFVGIGLVYNDLDKKTIYTVVSKPISRWHFIVGKYLGLLLTIAVNVFVMTWVFCAVLHMRDSFSSEVVARNLYTLTPEGVYVSKGVGAALWYYASEFGKALFLGLGNVVSLGFYSTQVTSGLFMASVLTMLEMAVIVAFAVLFSSFSSPTLSAFLTAIVWLIGKGNQDIYLLAQNLVKKVGGVEALVGGDKIVYYFATVSSHIAPNFDLFNQRDAIAYSQPVLLDLPTFGYAVIYSAGVLVLSILVFERRNFK